MARRAALLLSATFLLAARAAFAQAPPPEVDQALRSRVSEFFQDFVDGKFRQALNLVAEDTQDEYFSSPKMEIKAFKIDGITYAEGFKNATVKVTVKQVWRMKAEGFLKDTVVDTSMDTLWIVENEKWMWSNHAPKSNWITPMGPSADIKAAAPGDLLKKLNSESLNSRAEEILKQVDTSVKPSQVTFATDKPSSVKVVFHNGVQGSVGLSAEAPPRNLGLTVKIDQKDISANSDATVEIDFNPPADQTALPPQATLTLTVEPFGQSVPIEIRFEKPKQ